MDYDGYIKTYNQGDDAATAQQYYTEDITITMPLRTLSGRDEVIGFLTRGQAGIPEELKPRIVLRSEDHILAELDIVLRPERDVPDHFLTRPASILAYRLRETPLPAPPQPLMPIAERRPAFLPFQDCEGCYRPFRAQHPGRCRDCRPGNGLRAAG